MPTYTAGKPESSEFYVEPGEYTLRVIEAKEDTSKAGNDMIVMTVAPLTNEKRGSKFTERLVFTEKAFWRVDQFLKACGKHPGEGKEINVSAEEMIGWEFDAELEVESWENKDKGTKGKSNVIKTYIFNSEDDFSK